MEATAHEKRHWVRLTYACNNRCVFCHDSIVQSGEMVPRDILEKEIAEGLEQGAKRLILSGGEPSIHPDFMDLVAFGKRVGYRWVQVVSNGRMFAYASFASSVVQAGLDEATFSLHGHTPELHDSLVGVKGAFAQSMQGLENLMAAGLGVISVDIVLTSVNLPVLPQIMAFYLEHGIREFDLLWLVPFGRAWQDRRDLFVGPKQAGDTLREAVKMARSRGAVVWTNRLPARMLEGMEDLIQDPGKIHDEVRGRRPKFQMLINDGIELPCRQADRCELCFMKPYCKALDWVLEQHSNGSYSALSVDLRHEQSPQGPWSKARKLHIRGAGCSEAASFVRDISGWDGEIVLRLDHLPEQDPAKEDWGRGNLVRVASNKPEVLDEMLRYASVDLEIILDKNSAGWICSNTQRLASFPKTLYVSLRKFASLEQVHQEGVEPRGALSCLHKVDFVLFNAAACLAPWARREEEKVPLEMGVLSADDLLHLESFTDHFIKNLYTVWASSCESCSWRGACPGIGVNLVREFGFGMVDPI